MKNTVWYKGRSGNSCFCHSVRNTSIHRKRYSVQKYANEPKEAIPCWISVCPDCLVQLSGDHGPACPNQPCLLLSLTEIARSIPPMVLQLWKDVTGSKWFWRREKTGAERSLSSESLLNHTFFLGKSHIYMRNLHVLVTVAEYFQESRIINVLAAWDCFFPNCKCCSICHKTIIPTAWPSPLKGMGTCLWLEFEEGRWHCVWHCVWHCPAVPCWPRPASEETNQLGRPVFLSLFCRVSY